MTPRARKATARASVSLTGEERRRNQPLREVLEELLEHARTIARRVKDMTPEEMDYAQQRLEWLADEVWRLAAGAPPE
jgi:hypothetical protein